MGSGIQRLLALSATLVGLGGCAMAPSGPDADDDPSKVPTLVVTGSRIPHKVPGGKPTGVKTISREGFEEDMKGNQMPHRQGG
jgi:hypothetical protein